MFDCRAGDDYAAGCTHDHDFHYERSLQWWNYGKCDGHCFWWYCSLYVFLEYHTCTNDGYGHRAGRWILYGDGYGCEWVYDHGDGHYYAGNSYYGYDDCYQC